MSEDKKEVKKEESSLGDELQVYELGYHLLPTISLENLDKEVLAIKSVIEKNGALFIGEEGSPKTTQLAYSMNKVIGNKKTDFDTTHFGWIKFEANPESIVKIDTNLMAIENILRFLLIKSVRESKMISRKPSIVGKIPQTAKVSKPKGKEVAEPISEKEVDKAIEELIVE
jgi:ribosomal protein S6